MSLTIDELWRRSDFILRGRSAFRLHADGVIDGLEGAMERRPCRIGWFINFDENYKHAFVMTPSFGEECPSALQNNSLIEHLNELLSGIEITSSNVNPLVRDPGSLANCVFTSKVYIFTDVLQRPRDFIREAFKQHQLEAVIIDNERWEVQWGEAKPDAFICHDHRDKSEFGDPVYEQLARMPLKIFYDKYSIRIGDDLVEKIERGLAECKFAIILVSKTFLENKAWASHEMRALIHRQIAEGRKKLILPIWIDVSSEEVRARSPMLAKIAAQRFQDGVEELAREINTVISNES
jgi:hypothetical protein